MNTSTYCYTIKCPFKVSTILVIDDDHFTCDLTKNILLNMKIKRVLVAHSASEAQLIMLNEKVDLIVCDNVMAGISGIDFLKKLKKENNKIPFVFLMGGPITDSFLQEAKKAEVFAILLKPINPKLLVDKIKKALSVNCCNNCLSMR